VSARIDGLAGLGGALPVQRRRVAAPGFDQALERLLDAPAPAEPEEATGGLRLSRHAEARLESRGISLGGEERARLEAAVDELASRGAKKSLVLTGDNAFIVGVPKRTVITVMSREEALGQIFTDLDSTYVAA
jgi:flagellar operon protein